MLLNMYYKLLWWWAICAAKVNTNITIPLTYFADGAARNTVYWVRDSYAYNTPAYHNMFIRPYAGMLSQAAQPEYLRIGSNSNHIGYYPNFVVGSGTTAVTADDYRVEKEIVSGLACEALTSEVNEANHTAVFRKTLRNTSDADITITEVGLTGPVYTNSGPTQALIYREILETPVTIAPGESATLKITVEHRYPSA